MHTLKCVCVCVCVCVSVCVSVCVCSQPTGFPCFHNMGGGGNSGGGGGDIRQHGSNLVGWSSSLRAGRETHTHLYTHCIIYTACTWRKGRRTHTHTHTHTHAHTPVGLMSHLSARSGCCLCVCVGREPVPSTERRRGTPTSSRSPSWTV